MPRRTHLPDDLLPLPARAGIDGSMAVQARKMPEETTFLLGLAARHTFIWGVVGWFDLCAPSIGAALQAAAQFSKCSRCWSTTIPTPP